MKNVVKVWLKKNYHSKIPNDYKAQLSDSLNLDIKDIVDRMIEDGLTINKDIVLDIVRLFNEKSAELAVTGNRVNTGLVTLQPEVKGSFPQKRQLPDSTKLVVTCLVGTELQKVIANTEITIIEKMDSLVAEDEIQDISTQINHSVLNRRLPEIENPPCGIAFREWLRKA